MPLHPVELGFAVLYKYLYFKSRGVYNSVMVKSELPDEKVTVFGDEWHEDRWHRRRSSGSFFGLILITAGVLLILNTLNILSARVWDYIWKFWPFILIYWGLDIILGGNIVTKGLVRFIGLLMLIFIVLFAIHQVNPSLLSGLPPVFLQIFDIMKGVSR